MADLRIQVFSLQEKPSSLDFGPKDTFPKAPWPERWVPPPLTRGIRATALPVPQDSALVWCPVKQKSHKLPNTSECMNVCTLVKYFDSTMRLILVAGGIPASSLTAYGCRLFLRMLVWTKFTTSGRIGALNTAGRTTFLPADSPFSE